MMKMMMTTMMASWILVGIQYNDEIESGIDDNILEDDDDDGDGVPDINEDDDEL